MGKLGYPSRLSAIRLRQVIGEAAVACVAIGLATGAHFLVDLFFRGVALFAFVFPALAGATLVSGWRSGLMVVLGCQTLVWYFLVPTRSSFSFTTASDALNLLLTTAAQLLLLWFVARYRATQRHATAVLEARQEELNRALSRLREQAATDRLLLEREAALRATRQNLEAIYQASGDGLALCEALRDGEGRVIDYQVIEVNRAHAELTGSTREQMLTQRISTIDPPIDPRWFETAERVLDTGLMLNFDIRNRATGRWLNIRVSRVSGALFQQTFVDISDRYKLEEQRHALLKEMSHRVMNNFQMAAGFLHMEAVHAEPAAKEQLKTAERRIQVLAKLHSLLTYTDSDQNINAGAYIKEICGFLVSTLARPEAVTIVCETCDIFMPTDMVIPLGFVVTELVTNSAKYAYPPPKTGTIRINLSPWPDGWVLTIEDRGAGFGDAEPKDAGGLGALLVRRFVDQIGAELMTTSDNGVRHRITSRANP